MLLRRRRSRSRRRRQPREEVGSPAIGARGRAGRTCAAKEVLEDPESAKIAERVADEVAAAVINICSVVDPELVVVGGGTATDALLTRVRYRVGGRADVQARAAPLGARRRGPALRRAVRRPRRHALTTGGRMRLPRRSRAALDYDGTIAWHGSVDGRRSRRSSGAKDVGAQADHGDGPRGARAAAAFPRLDLFDRIVAENGALLYDAGSARNELLAPSRRRRRFVERCAARGVDAALGRPRHRRHLGAARARGARGHPRPRARAAGHLQQGRGHGAAAGVNKATGLAAALGRAAACRRTTSSASATPRTTTRSSSAVRVRRRGGERDARR